MYKYFGFGLDILSDIEFPELSPASFDIPEIVIKTGEIPGILNGKIIQSADFTYIIRDDELMFSVKDIANYYAGYGREIIVAPVEGYAAMRSIRLFILATVMAAILLQRRLLPLHASAILANDELILLCGDAGAGKSTTLAGLMKSGYTIFSDDIIVLQQHPDNNIVNGTASYPMIKLWENSLQTLDHHLFQDRSFPVRPGLNKYGIFFHEIFNRLQYPLKKILLLKIGTQDFIQTEQLTGMQAFEQVSNQIYRPILLQSQLMRTMSFKIIGQLLQHTDIYLISRPVRCKPEDLLSVITSFT